MTRTLPEPNVESFDLTTILAALADPARRTLLTELHHGVQPIYCSQLDDKADLGLAAATISHHYRVLREAGLTRTTVVGKQREISIRYEDMESRFPGLLEATLGRD